MSVNVNTVYSRVLAILNKEQRGFLTPQEFNLFANQAQMDIFEQYFYDINQFSRIHGNNTEYSDMLDNLSEKQHIFSKRAALSHDGSPNTSFNRPTDLYRIGQIHWQKRECQRMERRDRFYVELSPLLGPTDDFPIYSESEDGYQIFGNSQLDSTTSPAPKIDYLRKPATVSWVGTNVNGVPLYDANTSTNFELHPSEETELVIKILELAGLLIKDPSIYQAAVADQAKSVQQEKA